MFNLNSNLLSGSTSWDTNYARTYLQISKDQLEKINKIPGWSKTVPENEKTSENVEKQLTQQTSAENIPTSFTNISIKDDSNLKIQNRNSDLQSKVQSKSEKEIFLKNFSLSPLKKNNTSAYSLKRSSSLPDMHQELQSYNEPEGFSRKRTHSIGKDISSSKLQLRFKKNLLKETYTVPLISDDGVNPDKRFGIDSHKSFSCPLKQSNETSKQKRFKSLDDNILNHIYLKEIMTCEIKSDTGPRSSNGAVQAVLEQERNSFEKRLLLLEKRFSPSKEMSTSSFNARFINVENSNFEKLFRNAEEIGEIVTIKDRPDLFENLTDKVQNSSVSKSQSVELKADSQPFNEKSDASDKDRATNISKTAISNFDSFLSPEIPCGQPVPTEVPSQSELFPSQESAKLHSAAKLQPVPCGQPLPMEVPTATEPVPSQKVAKLNTPSKSQNSKFLDNKMVAEKTSGTFSVFSASSNEKASDLVSSKELVTKRKRRNRSEKSSKKLDAKRIKRIDIQFSSVQMNTMLEIMKLFHTEV
ncbi:hypothetical protein HNY73_016309 [Argiope bruennichi]|uniref:Uncharacterized protein n=1 Tax=Argiope bruennichi TaxID=94029 RepID=A0A8T0EIF6_ARGBR|nr:hypothetical protein HNY73_016309 [Argiope bruennichi]